MRKNAADCRVKDCRHFSSRNCGCGEEIDCRLCAECSFVQVVSDAQRADHCLLFVVHLHIRSADSNGTDGKKRSADRGLRLVAVAVLKEDRLVLFGIACGGCRNFVNSGSLFEEQEVCGLFFQRTLCLFFCCGIPGTRGAVGDVCNVCFDCRKLCSAGSLFKGCLFCFCIVHVKGRYTAVSPAVFAENTD